MLFAAFCAWPAGTAVVIVSLMVGFIALWIVSAGLLMALIIAGLLIAGFMAWLVALLICSARYCSLLSSLTISSACCVASLLSMRKIKPPLRSLVTLPVFRYKAVPALSIITWL